MPKKRVHELAKELGLESKVLIARLEKIGIPVKSASSSLDEDEVGKSEKRTDRRRASRSCGAKNKNHGNQASHSRYCRGNTG